MRFGNILWTTLALSMVLGSAWANYLPLYDDVDGVLPQTQLVYRDEAQMQFEVVIPGLELQEGWLEGKRWDRVEIPGGGQMQELGNPELPHYTRLLAIPARAGVHAEFEPLETRLIPNLDLMPAQGYDIQDGSQKSILTHYNAARYQSDAFYPESRVHVGTPALLRGVRLVTLQLNPVQYNPVTRELRVATRFRVTVRFAGEDHSQVPTRQVPLSPSWAASMSEALLNPEDLELDEQQVGSYLIICKNDAILINYLQPLIEWKNRKGHAVTLQTCSSYATNTTVKSLIQTAYNTWSVPPEFVLLIGDVSGQGSYSLPGWPTNDNYTIDHPYAQLDGSDILADVALGRLPAGTSTELQTMINKILFYEKMPYTTTTDWYHQGVVIAGNEDAGISSVQTNRWIKTRMVQREYTRIDTFWYWMPGSVESTLSPAINNGVICANYRGNNHMENFTTWSIDALSNGRKLPFVVTITCGTGGFGSWGMGGESLMQHFVTVGTPTTPKGAVACVGTATMDTHTRQNNTVDIGIWSGIFEMGITKAGEALNYGKLQLYYTYQDHDPTSVENFSAWNALAGDPGLELFTQAIQYLNCDVPASLPFGSNALSLTVNETGVGPLENAQVCFYKSGTGGTQVVGYTNAAGQITLPVSVTAVGNLKVTITKQNYYPVVDSLDVIQAPVAVGYFSHTIDDDQQGGSSGDGDGIINPGETVQLPLTLKNYGNTTTATGVTATGSLNDPYASLSNPVQNFPDLTPGSTGSSSSAYLLTVAPNCPANYSLTLPFTANSAQGSWPGVLNFNVASYALTILSAIASGSDTLLSPGETTNFLLTVNNAGAKTATNLTATLSSLSSYVTVNDNSAAFGTVNVNSTMTCSSNPFNLTAAANAPPGQQVNLVVAFHANDAVQSDTITIALGAKTQADPTGPDAYGYYCYDNTDVNYPQHPTYNWVEIDPAYGGTGATQLPLSDPAENQDSSVIVNLPFVFRYYGQPTNTLTVCSNGWLSCFADVSYNDFRNYPIPMCMGPFAMIAPFWDDLVTWSGGHIFTKYIAASRCFIIEWSRLENLNTTTQQVFEVVLFDPAYYATPTGDGDIIFQYHTITQIYGPTDDNPFSTVGIESWNQQDGIEVTYWNSYDDPATAPLANSRAYRFTTNFSYQPPGAGVHITLTPFNPPIQIPASGGSFQYTVAVQNQTSSPLTFDGWIMQQLPNLTWQGPMLGPITLTLPGNVTISRERNQNVPASALPGVYTYRGYVGVYANTKWDSSSFTYTKLTTGDGPIVSDWDNWGEAFEPFLAQSEILALPDAYALEQNYPNPFNPTTAISYKLQAASRVSLQVYDTAGRLVVTLVEGDLEAGDYNVTFDAHQLASGIYLYRLEAGDFKATKKMVLVK